MAGAGYKLFNTGDVLTAAQVNTYLMEQTVMVFDDAASRTTALTGVVSEGMISYLKDTNAVEVYNGSAWVASDDPNAIQNTIVDAKGDLITATAADTPARLAVGSNKKVLTADSSTASGLAWTSGGLTLISRVSFTNVASQIFDNVFDASLYRTYLVVIEQINSYTGIAGDDLLLQFRYGSTTETGGYYGATYGYPYNSSTLQIANMNNANHIILNNDVGSSAYPTSASFDIMLTSSGSGIISVVGGGYAPVTAIAQTIQAGCSNARTYTGFLLKSSSSNISGDVAIYGRSI